MPITAKARGGRAPGGVVPGARGLRDLADVTDADLAKVSERLTPNIPQAGTDEVGGRMKLAEDAQARTAPGRVAEQIAALGTTVDTPPPPGPCGGR